MISKITRASLFVLLVTTSLLALSPAYPETPQPPPPTLEQIWESTDAIVYGRAVRVQVSITDTLRPVYDSTLRVERAWKNKLAGDLHIEGTRPDDYPDAVPLHIGETYLVRLQKLPNKEAYTLAEVREFRLGPKGEPLPEPPPPSFGNPFSLFGQQPEPPRYNEGALSLFEFAERMTGHEESAQRARELIRVPKEERERAAKEAARRAKNESDFLAAASAEFEAARKTENLASRKSLLLALKHRLKDRFDNGTQELKGKIFAELSVIDTLLANGVKTNRPSDP